MNVLLYSKPITPRLEYIVRLLFQDLLGLTPELTSDVQVFRACTGVKLWYGAAPAEPRVCLVSSCGLLEATGILPGDTPVGQVEGMPVLYPDDSAGTACFPFDVFSAAFFMVTRYEEYLPFAADAHGRFPASASLAYRHGFLHQPIVQVWARMLVQWLARTFPSLSYRLPDYRYEPTYDVDTAWAFRSKPVWRLAGGVAKAILQLKLREAGNRLAVWAGLKQDPYDRFAYLDGLHQRHGLSPLYFFLLGNGRGYDRNNAATGTAMRNLVRRTAARHAIGLHPSYGSGQSGATLAAEVDLLRRISGIEVGRSRQHYLLLRFPQTYRALIAAGIRHDYTMGFADAPGFRAGIAIPFPWYDLEREAATSLMVHPFQVMDVTLKDYCALSAQDAIAQAGALIAATKETGGVFCTLWHNSSFTASEGWEGWQGVYEAIVREALPAQTATPDLSDVG